MTEPIQVVQWVVEAAEQRKALNVVVLDLRKISLIADYFVVCSGRSTVQVKAIAEFIEDYLETKGVFVLHREGKREGQWSLLDYGAVVVHVFRDEERRFYALESLWADAELMESFSVEGAKDLEYGSNKIARSRVDF
ncbi:MAG: ribosome silencing factor [Syntrophomonadaceae bacterium]|nr:ribosome silencing factor [Syntrophomonadaceae bacterium]